MNIKTHVPEIVFRRLKHSSFASHETHCFETFVDVDGYTFWAENGGTGGPDNYSPVDNSAKARANYACAMWRLDNYAIQLGHDSKYGSSVEIVVGDALEKVLQAAGEKRAFQRFVSSLSSTIYSTRNGKVYSLKCRDGVTKEALAKHEQRFPDAEILNGLDLEKSWAIVKAAKGY